MGMPAGYMGNPAMQMPPNMGGPQPMVPQGPRPSHRSDLITLYIGNLSEDVYDSELFGFFK